MRGGSSPRGRMMMQACRWIATRQISGQASTTLSHNESALSQSMRTSHVGICMKLIETNHQRFHGAGAGFSCQSE